MGEVQRWWLSAAARVFVLLTMGAPILWDRDTDALAGLLTLAGIWSVAQLAEVRPVLPAVTSAVEAAVVGAVCATVMDSNVALLGALAVQPFTAGLHRGVRGVATALSAELAALVVVTTAVTGSGLSSDQSFGVFTWSVTGVGLGLIAAFLHAVMQRTPDGLEPYRYAQSLIRELIDLSGGLSSGLDPQVLAGHLVSVVRDELPTSTLTLYVPRHDDVTPLVAETMGPEPDTGALEELAVRALGSRSTVVDGRYFAFPLTTESGTPAAVAGVLSDRLDPERIGLTERIRRLLPRLEAGAVHLDTALLFLAFRDAATADERRRLSREMHDGVAQDIASLGYLVDALAVRLGAPDAEERLEVLRERITAVVAEVRQTVVNLRTGVGSSESLGAAIGAVARNLRTVSGIPIQVTLDESPTRLRPEVEAELFRIAQEAMTNAVKHACAEQIDVHCQVHPPAAVITVADDGRGLQEARHDSSGLKIMRERALLIGAELTIDESPTGGVRVCVRLPAAGHRPSNPTDSAQHRTVTA